MSSKQFTAKIFRFLHRVNADDKLPHTVAKVAIALADYFNEGEGGMAWPSCRTIADDSALSEHTIIRSVRLLGERGHLRIEWGKQGRGHPNRYWMGERDQQTDLFEDTKPAPAQVFDPEIKPAISSRKPAISSRKPALAQETLSKNHLRTTEEKKESHVPALSSQGSRKKEAFRRKQARGKELSPKPEIELAERFGEFWAVYPRQVAKEAARKAFEAAVRGGTDPDTIIAGANLYAIGEQLRIQRGEDPKYTAHGSTWLRGRRWEDPPPVGVVLDQSGNVVAIEQPENHPKSLLELAQELQIASGGKSW